MSMAFRMAMVILACFFAWGIPLVSADICADYNCLRGKCVQVNAIPPVKCVCDEGWSNILNFSFLSCAIPNCDFSLHCDKTSNASNVHAAAPESSSSFSIFNPCTYSICGEGDCISSNDSALIHGYTCNCHPGYANLLNSSSGVCVSDCNIGADCNQLGITLGPSSSPSSDHKNNSSTVSDSTSSASATHGIQSFQSVFFGGIAVLPLLYSFRLEQF